MPSRGYTVADLQDSEFLLQAAAALEDSSDSDTEEFADLLFAAAAEPLLNNLPKTL